MWEYKIVGLLCLNLWPYLPPQDELDITGDVWFLDANSAYSHIEAGSPINASFPSPAPPPAPPPAASLGAEFLYQRSLALLTGEMKLEVK